MVENTQLAEHIEQNENSFTLEHRSLGTLHYTEKDRIFFPQGLLGFEKNKYYLLRDHEESYPFVWMINAEMPELSFIMVNPMLFCPEYSPNISRRELNELEIANPQSLLMYVIVTLHQDSYQTTANLRAPILINNEKKLGKQLVLLDDQYSTKHRILNPEHGET